MVDVKASGPPHVLELWLGLSKVMLPVTCGRGEGLRTTSCLRTVVGLSKVMLPVTCVKKVHVVGIPGEGIAVPLTCLIPVVEVKASGPP